MTDAELEQEVVELARALIRVDTSNPPGRETAAAQLLAAYLEAASVECELTGPDPERLNLVARVRGSGRGPSLMLAGHTDVVPAGSMGWTCPPFEGTIRDGLLVGRGAADMKGELAARVVALAAIARSGEPPEGDVVLIAASDEEDNTAGVGMSWLAHERPDLACDFALNEGGGLRLELADGRQVVTLVVGEKQTGSLRLRVLGRGGHASMPSLADNPLRHAAVAVHRLLAHQAPVRMVDAVRRALTAIGAPEGDDEGAVAWAAEQHPVLAHLLAAMARLTITPTGLRTFEPSNVIPPFADVVCDIRALPGQSIADVERHVADALGDGVAYELEMLAPLDGGSVSPVDTPLFRVCERYVADRLPSATVLPVLSTGFTDSHHLRREHGTVAYGFAPVLSSDPIRYLRGMHNADEAIAIADLVEMARFHVHAVRTLGAWLSVSDRR